MSTNRTQGAGRVDSRRESQSERVFAAREWNPVVVREGRARWRGARAFWLALGYASFLALVLWWSYSHPRGPIVVGGVVENETPIEAFGAAAQMGHELFGVLSYCQLGAWLLLAPILTSSSLSGERRRGLLEGLLLSRLPAIQIVRGKWASALGLIVLLQLAGLPVMAVCFLLGGVSPGEFVGAFAIQLATACCGAACGIVASSYSRSNSDAASGAIALVLLWLVATGLACAMLRAMTTAGYIPIVSEGVSLIICTNPIAAMVLLFSPAPWQPSNEFLSFGLSGVLFAEGCGWVVSVGGMALLTSWHLRRAGQVLRRSPETFDQPPATPQHAASTYTPPASSIAASEGWERGQSSREAAQAASTRQPGRWQMPLLSQIVFGSAMLRRELTLLWSWPRLLANEHAGLWLLMLMLSVLALTALISLFESPRSARDVWAGVLVLYGIAGVLLCAARPASSIAHEREGGLWQGLNLTLLSPLQVTGAKVWAPMVACLGYGSPAWVFLALSAWQGQIGIGGAMGGVLIMLLAWAQVASWSTLVGARARLAASALGWGLGGPVLAWAAIPLLMSLFNSPLEGSILQLVSLLHPITALEAGSTMSPAMLIVALALHASLATILFAAAWREVRDSNRENGKAAREA